MNFEMGKKSGQIPAFGNWDAATDLPITQYFETARQAGLLRFPAATHRHRQYYSGSSNGYSFNDLYTTDFQKPPIRALHVAPHHRQQSGHGDEEYPWRRRRQQRTYDGMVDQHRTRRNSQRPFHTDHYTSKQFPTHSAIADVIKPPPTVTNTAKPVDEDLYKIPPELLLRRSKRKKMLGFFSRCLVPSCSA